MLSYHSSSLSFTSCCCLLCASEVCKLFTVYTVRHSLSSSSASDCRVFSLGGGKEKKVWCLKRLALYRPGNGMEGPPSTPPPPPPPLPLPLHSFHRVFRLEWRRCGISSASSWSCSVKVPLFMREKSGRGNVYINVQAVTSKHLICSQV